MLHRQLATHRPHVRAAKRADSCSHAAAFAKRRPASSAAALPSPFQDSDASRAAPAQCSDSATPRADVVALLVASLCS